MISIYTDSIFFEQRFLNRLHIPGQYQIHHSIHEYVASQNDTKIAFTTERRWHDYDIGDPERLPEVPGQIDKCPKAGFDDKIAQLSACSDLVFTFDSELHTTHEQFWSRCHFDNVFWVYPGAVNGDTFIGNHTIPWISFFGWQQWYNSRPEKLEEINYSLPKPLSFDILLGRIRPHRDFVYSAVHNNNLQNKVIMTYFKDASELTADNFIWEPDSNSNLTNIGGSNEQVIYCGMSVSISSIIPTAVFNKTAYSIIAETNFDNRITFYTEKTAKPIIARRLFVAFSGYKFLENLRKLGFQTFDNVIDESYDLIEDNEARWTAAFEQVKLLCELDQSQVFSKIKDRLEHNYHLLAQTNWDQHTADLIQQKLNKVFNK